MNNSLIDSLAKATNYTQTENGAIAHKSTLSKVYDLFAFGGAYRKRTLTDCIFLFKEALEENEMLAMKCLFYLRDIRGGAGERRFFRACYKWLCDNKPEIAKRNLILISEYGRWDDLIYIAEGTKLQDDMLEIIKIQAQLDADSRTPSLLGKWLPSENASSYESNRLGNLVRKSLNMTHKEYRKLLSGLRTKINIVEKLMSENRWDEIEFDKLPSKAGIKYKNAFARRDILAKKYETFVKNEATKVNAQALYPYEVVYQATKGIKESWNGYSREEGSFSQVDRLAIEKYWNNLPNYIPDDKQHNILCVCDTSGSMTTGNGASKPINVAIGLSMYAAERLTGPFKDHYISFSSKPQLIKISGIDFVDKVERIYETNLCEDTNLTATFDLLKNTVLNGEAKAEDLPQTLVIISDMEINSGVDFGDDIKFYIKAETEQKAMQTTMEKIRKEWSAAGLTVPKLVYWNVDARNNTILDLGENVSYVSGASPILFEQVCKGVTGIDLMLDKLLESGRYDAVQ